MSQKIAPGTRVTCSYRGGHVGTVLADDDPIAWSRSLAFPQEHPDPAAVKAYVKDLADRGWENPDQQPVLWDFGKMWWEEKLEPLLEAVPEDYAFYETTEEMVIEDGAVGEMIAGDTASRHEIH